MPLSVSLRDAKPADCRFVWATNNHPSVRKQSISTDTIPWESHQGWFSAVLESDHRRLWIAVSDGQRVGVVRMDGEPGSSKATINIALNPDWRGKGLGRQLIRIASDRALEQHGIERVIALIRPDNQASIRAFEAAGFSRTGEHEVQDVALNEYEYKHE